VSLLIGGTLLLVGFAASLVFERYRVPDFFMLLLLGLLLGHLPIDPFGPTAVANLEPILPVFIHLTLAFILFEGGLALNMKRHGRRGGLALAAHILGAMALTMAVTYLLATRILGFSPITGIAFAAAFSGPSATIVMSFATRLRLGPRARGAIVFEGVLGNVVAAVVVLFAIQFPGAPPALEALVPYLAFVGLAALVGFIYGLAWRVGMSGLLAFKFQYIATLALAVIVYAVGEGFVGGNGVVAVFVFGLTVAYGHAEISRIEETGGEGLRAFQGEVSFVLRTFFFVYLGLTIRLEAFTIPALVAALLLTMGFVVARVPTSLGLGRAYRFTRRETRVVIGTVGRGLTDIVLILFALQSGVLPAADVPLVLALLPLVVLSAAITCAALVAWAERTREASPAPAVPQAP
jgi:cell volume regulation protein A